MSSVGRWHWQLELHCHVTWKVHKVSEHGCRKRDVKFNFGDVELALVIAWFGRQLWINFLSMILKLFCNCPSL